VGADADMGGKRFWLSSSWSMALLYNVVELELVMTSGRRAPARVRCSCLRVTCDFRTIQDRAGAATVQSCEIRLIENLSVCALKTNIDNTDAEK